MHRDGSNPLLEIIEPAIAVRHAGFMEAIDSLQGLDVADTAVESKAEPPLQVAGVGQRRQISAELLLHCRSYDGCGRRDAVIEYKVPYEGGRVEQAGAAGRR